MKCKCVSCLHEMGVHGMRLSVKEPCPLHRACGGGREGRRCGLHQKPWPSWVGTTPETFRGSGLFTSQMEGRPCSFTLGWARACASSALGWLQSRVHARQVHPGLSAWRGPPRVGTLGCADGDGEGLEPDVSGGGEWPGQVARAGRGLTDSPPTHGFLLVL